MGVASSRGRDGERHGVDGMARGAGEPSAKRAKVDEADEKEDPLVRRREELVVAALPLDQILVQGSVMAAWPMAHHQVDRRARG